MDQPRFEALDVPVKKGGLMGTLVGPGPTPGSERIYFNFRQDGGKLFLVQVDPDTGDAKQYPSPVGTGAWGFIVGPDDKIYLGTHEGVDPGDDGQILVFDPKSPDDNIRIVGRPSPTETYIWMYTVGNDGKLYGCTYPEAKLVSFDPESGALIDHGRMDPEQKYTRSICTGPDGTIYLGIGYGRANVIAYSPGTGEHRSILPDAYRAHPSQTVAQVYTGVDDNVYIQTQKVVGEKTASVTLRVTDSGVEETDSPASAVSTTTFADGRRVTGADLYGNYTIVHPDGREEAETFTYEGSAGLFMVYGGPLGRIYGGTYMPNEFFAYDPATGESINPGNATEVGGEIYSMLDHDGLLYLCAYPGAFLSKYDPTKPWNYGREPGNNPQGFGQLVNVKPGHLRPRAMIHGPDKRIYIGSYPEYGRHGGSLGVWDPNTDTLIENYHHLIKDQSIVSLAYDEKTGLIFGGSSTAGGGGTEPVAEVAKFFAFDPAAKKLVFEQAPIKDARSIRTLVQVDRRLFGLGGKDVLFVYDIDQQRVVHQGSTGLGSVLDQCMALWEDGKLYGVTGKSIFRLNPRTYAVDVLAEYPGKIRCGLAIDEHGIYFGDRATLMRYNW
jgi:outer membrane protein assembly factor BamB